MPNTTEETRAAVEQCFAHVASWTGYRTSSCTEGTLVPAGKGMESP
jgi:hypothetical protein